MAEKVWEEITEANEHKFEVGQDVLTRCGKCKLDLAHVIMSKVEDAIAKVQCKTCNGEHKFKRAKKKKATKKKATTRRATSTAAIERLWNEKTSGRDLDSARSYRFEDKYDVDDMINHTKFGLGVITELLGYEKMSVVFKEYEKILIHNQQ